MPDEASTAQIIADLLVHTYEIHERIIARTGGIEGLRDVSALHSAVARPFATFAGQDMYPDAFEKAAALFHSLIKSHPFMDATKRTALRRHCISYTSLAIHIHLRCPRMRSSASALP
ncbi:MAG: type II toxin-antitoxin system death-on-curing family toxin [Roseiflexaceae bacterium]